MKFMHSLVGVMAAIGVFSSGCKASIEGTVPPALPVIGGTHLKAEASTISTTGTTGCVVLIFIDAEGRVIDRASGSSPMEIPTPPGTNRVRVEPCPSSPFLAHHGRTPHRAHYPFMSLPCGLQDHLRFLSATVETNRQGEAESLFSERDRNWISTSGSPLLVVHSMVEVERVGADLEVHVIAQDAILRLDLEWNDEPYATLADALLTETNGWHVATFQIPAADVETTAGARNALQYEMDTVRRTGDSFEAAVTVDP